MSEVLDPPAGQAAAQTPANPAASTSSQDSGAPANGGAPNGEASGGAAASGAAPAKPKRARRSAEDLLADAKRKLEEDQRKAHEAFAAKQAKLLEKAVPMSKRKTAAYELLLKLRDAARKHPDHAKSSNDALDAFIADAVNKAIPATDAAPEAGSEAP